MPSAPYSQTLVNTAVLAATLADRSKGYVDQVSKQLPLFMWLKDKGRYKPAEGARIERAVEYGLDETEPSFQGLEQLNLQEQDNVTIIEANWKQYYKSIVISGLDKDVKNTGNKIFDLLEQKEQNALNSLQTDMNEHFYLDGTGNSSKRVTGLGAIIAEDPTTGELFGINRATAGNEWWRNQSVDTNAQFWSTTTAEAVGYNDMEKLKMYCGRLKVGGKKDRYPDLILSTEDYYLFYNRQVNKTGTRFVNQKVRDLGFDNLMFGGATMIADQDCPDDAGGHDKAFFINSRFMELCYAPRVNFKTTPLREAEDQNGFSAKIYWAGELICTNCAKQGIHQGVQDFTGS